HPTAHRARDCARLPHGGAMPASWPNTAEALIAEQQRLAAARPAPWRMRPGALALAGCFVCFPRGIEGEGAAGDPGWAAAALLAPGRRPRVAIVEGRAGAGYEPGLLALRRGRC